MSDHRTRMEVGVEFQPLPIMEYLVQLFNNYVVDEKFVQKNVFYHCKKVPAINAQ